MPPIFTTETEFEKFLITEYLKFGSIDKVFKLHNYNLPISFASFHRLLNKYKIVKSAGPNSKLSESLHFLSLLNTYKLPLERVYHRFTPNSIQVSTNTLHRILHNIRLGVTKRVGIALLISNSESPNQFLLGQDDSLLNSKLGEKGDWSLPMGYTRQQDSFAKGIKRVLQQEVFVRETIENKFPKNIIPKDPQPIFCINIADIKVFVFKLELTKNYTFSSFKLKKHLYFYPSEVQKLKTRGGVVDIFKMYLTGSIQTSSNSDFNQNLCLLPLKAKIR